MSNELQVTIFSVRLVRLAGLRTKTTALNVVFTGLVASDAGPAGDMGLRSWIVDERCDRSRSISGRWLLDMARWGLRWSAEAGVADAAALCGSGVLVAALDLWALDGRMFQHLDISLKRYQSPKDSVSIDTICALTANGVVFYLIASSSSAGGAA